MDLETLKSAEQTRAEIEVFKLLKAQLDAIRRGDRRDLAKVAFRELERCDEWLDELETHLKRFGRRKHIAA